MDSEQIIQYIVKALTDLIFNLEAIKHKDKNYTIEIKDGSGKIIKKIMI